MKNGIGKFLEASLEGAEAIVDTLTENEIVKSIPVVGTALKIISGSIDLRDRIFLSKIQRFIEEVETISRDQKSDFIEIIKVDKESISVAGETALLVLDKLSDLKKAELLGLYYVSFLMGQIDQYKFRRIASAIDIGFIDDIEIFLSEGLDELQSQKYFMESLSSSGITMISSGKTVGAIGELYYEASSMGRSMVEIWQENKKS